MTLCWHRRLGARAKGSQAVSPEANAAVGVENCQGPELSFPARSLVIQGGRRHGSPGPEAEDCITHSNSGSRGPAPVPTGPGDAPSQGTPYVCGNPRFTTSVSKQASPLLQSWPRSPPPEAASRPAPRSGRRCCLGLPGLRLDLFGRVKIKGKRGRRGPGPAGGRLVQFQGGEKPRAGSSRAASAAFLNLSLGLFRPPESGVTVVPIS